MTMGLDERSSGSHDHQNFKMIGGRLLWNLQCFSHRGVHKARMLPKAYTPEDEYSVGEDCCMLEDRKE